MEGFLVFDLSNNLVFNHHNNKFKIKLLKVARKMGIIDEKNENIDLDTILHIFNPLLANLRFMLIQFDNSFNYVKCKHGFNMVFDEHLGFVFLKVNDDKSIEWMQRSLAVHTAFIKHMVGPSIYSLKSDHNKSKIVTYLIENWNKLYETESFVLLETIEQLSVNNDVKNSVLSTLESVLEKVKESSTQKTHAILFSGNKFMSLFSNRSAQSIMPSDILFLNIFCQSIKLTQQIDSFLIFLQSSNNTSIPHVMHRIPINSDLTLLILIEHGHTIISSNLYETFVQLNKIKTLQSQSDLDNLVIETEKLDRVVKIIIDTQKKLKNNSREMEDCMKNFQNKYEILKKKYVDMLKIMDKNQLVKVESYLPYFVETTNDLFRLACTDDSWMKKDSNQIVQKIESSIIELSKLHELVEAKSKKNLTMSSYLEDFSGMIYFCYIDRQRGISYAPVIDIAGEATAKLIKRKIWDMVEMGRTYLLNGHTSFIWKDHAFSYSYSLWFEDANGQVLNPKDQSSITTMKPNQIPGMLAGDYYQHLVEASFPKAANSLNKIKVYELYTLHLSLVTPHLQLEHSRRLAATISDVTLVSNNLFDLL